MSQNTTLKCDTCGTEQPYDEAYHGWYHLGSSRAFSEAKVDVHACSPRCAAPLLRRMWAAIADDAEEVARKARDQAAVAKALADREAGNKLLGEALAEVLGGASQ